MKLSKRALIMVCALVLATTASAMGTIAYLTDKAQATNTFTVGNVDIDLDEADVDEDGNQKYPFDGNDDDDEPDVNISVDEDGNILVTDPSDPGKPPIIIKPENGNYPPTDVDGDGVKDTITVDPTTGVPTVNDKPLEPGRDTENEYNLVPGESYLKDPTLTVTQGSEKSYVRMIVELTGYADVAAAIGCTENELMDKLTNVDSATEWELKSVENGVFEYRYKEPVNASVETEDIVLPPLFTEFSVPTDLKYDQLKAISEAGFKMDIFGHAIQTASFDSEDEAWEAFDEQN